MLVDFSFRATVFVNKSLSSFELLITLLCVFLLPRYLMTKLYKVTYVLPCTSDITDVSLGVEVCVYVCVFAFILMFIKGRVAPRPRKKKVVC